MKKLLFLFAVLLLFSCKPQRPAKIVKRTEEEMIQKFDVIRHFEYKGHKYISFQYSPTPQSSYMGITHDPECTCHINKY